jgi:phosphoglycerol transferase MdoB-like AlkP superfamily enzyme
MKKKFEIAEGRGWSLSDDLSKEELIIYKDRYIAEIRELDDYIKQVFEVLAKRDLLSTTIIIITADHGESFGENGFLTHSLSDQGDRESTYRVPLAIYFPQEYKLKGRNISVLTSIADIVPTIYDLLGINWIALANISYVGNYGKSLLPYIIKSFDIKYKKEFLFGKKENTESTDFEKRKQEALKRLRSLGYIK